MARYCFYCSRALSPGEKCHCRTTGYSSAGSHAQSTGTAGSTSTGSTAGTADRTQTGTASGTAGSAKTATRDGAKSSTSGNTKGSGQKAGQGPGAFQRFFRAFNPFDTTTPPPRRAKTQSQSGQKDRQTSGSARYTAGRTGSQFNSRAILPELKRIGTYLIQPADSIRQAAQSASRQSVLLILVLQGILGGIFLMVASNQAILRSLLELSVATANQGGTFGSKLFVFTQGFGISLAGNLLLALAYQLALRYLFHLPVGYMRLLSGLSPSCLYFSIFLLAGVISLPASFFSALMMLMAGIAIATVAQFLAARTISGFDDNRNFILVTLVMLIFTGVIAMLLNLSLPLLQVLLNQSAII